jgi:hypothetical protein
MHNNILLRETETKRPIRRLSLKWEDNIRKAIRRIFWEHVKWIHLAQDKDQWQAFANTSYIKGGEFLG